MRQARRAPHVRARAELLLRRERAARQLIRAWPGSTPASDSGTSIEDIADAVGYVNSGVARAVYRHQIADTVTRAPAAMDHALAGGNTA